MASPTELLLAAWAALQLLSVAGVALFRLYLPPEPPAELTEAPDGVVAIVPVKGPAPGLTRLAQALLAQSAPLRVIFAVASKHDPAWPRLAALAEADPGRVRLVVAGPARNQGQKIANMLAALATLAPTDRYLVFLDADILPAPHAVGRLIHPLVRQGEAITSGYRWLAPAPRAPASWLGAAINLQVATLPRRVSWNLPWGGATAMTREAFERLDLLHAWRGALSDDLTLFRIAQRHGVRIRSIGDLMLPSPGEATIPGLWRFGVRQYRHLAWNLPAYALLAATLIGLQSIGWAWALVAGGAPAILIGYAAAPLRATLRIAIARRLPDAEQLRPPLSVAADAVAPFLVCWSHLAMILTGAMSRRIRWAGIDYWMKGGKVGRMRPVEPSSSLR